MSDLYAVHSILSTIIIRPATVADAQALVFLGRTTFLETFGSLYKQADLDAYLDSAYALPQIRAALADENTYIIVAEENGELVAYAKAGARMLPIDTGDLRAYELHRLYARRSHQRRGLGDALMEHVCAHASSTGHTHLYLGVWENNHTAQQFYARHDFTEVGEYAFHLGSHVDRDLILCKIL